jgi:hypothetical protein
VPAKRAIVWRYSQRFKYHTQPNMDANAMLIQELRGTLTPGRVARVTLERLRDAAWLRQTSEALGALYSEHTGAAARMCRHLLALQPGS